MNPLHFSVSATHKRISPPDTLVLGSLAISPLRPLRSGALGELRREQDAEVRFLQAFVQGEQAILRGDILEVDATAYRVNACSPYPLGAWIVNEIVVEDMLAPVLVEVVLVKRPTKTPDGSGGFTTVWNTAATTSGRVFTDSRLLQEKVVADAVSSRLSYTVALPSGTDVRRTDRLLVGPRILEVVVAIQESIQGATLAVCVEVK